MTTPAATDPQALEAERAALLKENAELRRSLERRPVQGKNIRDLVNLGMTHQQAEKVLSNKERFKRAAEAQEAKHRAGRDATQRARRRELDTLQSRHG